jgi:rubrerythrin
MSLTEEQEQHIRVENARRFALAAKKLSPQIYYDVLVLITDATKAKKEIFECRNCGKVTIGKCDICDRVK